MENILYTEGLVEYLKKKKQKKLEDEEKNKLIMKIITKHQNVYDSIIKSSPHINEEEATKFLAGLFKIFDNVGIESYFKGKKIQNNGTYVTLSDIKSRNKILSIDVDLFSFEKLKKGQQPTQQKTSHKKNMLISPNKFNKIRDLETFKPYFKYKFFFIFFYISPLSFKYFFIIKKDLFKIKLKLKILKNK